MVNYNLYTQPASNTSAHCTSGNEEQPPTVYQLDVHKSSASDESGIATASAVIHATADQ